MYTPFAKATEILLNQAKRITATERVPLAEAVGRVLAEEVLTDRDVPPFNRVAMDGYALRRADLPGPLTVLETVPAGKAPQVPVTGGCCSKVMTGAPLPEGADMVVQVELVEALLPEGVLFMPDAAALKTNNIARQGEDMPQGALFVERGTRIESKTLGILASVGVARPLVYKAPVVAVIVTGDEVLEPHEQPERHQIRNANGVQLVSQLTSAGVTPRYYGITSDDPAALRAVFERAHAECDGMLFSGGVSMGDFDFVPGIMEEKGYEILFNKVAAKPGRPTTFAVADDRWIFGMPGNPVTSFVVFEMMVRPFLYAMLGTRLPSDLKGLLGSDVRIKKSLRTTWIPCRLDDEGALHALTYHGSGHFHSLKRAWGLLRFDPESEGAKGGDLVYVRPL